MTSILFNLKLTHSKCFLKTGKNFWPLSKNFKKSLLGCQKQCSGCVNVRPFSTAVENSDKSTQNNANKASNKDSSLIYLGLLTHQIKGVKVLTCVSSIGGIVLQPLLLQKVLNENTTAVSVALFITIGFFTFVTPFLLHMVTKKYVTEIWYNSATDTYTATLLSFFLRKININFKIEDIQIPMSLSMFTTMHIKGKPVFVNTESFLELEHYIKIMESNNKPMDVNLNNISHDSNEHGNKVQ